MWNMTIIRVLTVADIHQSKSLIRQLELACKMHEPDVLAFVGDFLNAFETGATKEQYALEECARKYSAMAARHIVFVRGNHEEQNWTNFVYSWPHEKRSLIALHGTAFMLPPLVIVGFPCRMGDEEGWCNSLPKNGANVIDIAKPSGRSPLPAGAYGWLPKLMKKLGPAGRTLWLLHEPPTNSVIGSETSWNAQWKEAIENYQPLLTVSGHEHRAPIESARWHLKVGNTVCVNVGQSGGMLRYGVVELSFMNEVSVLPDNVEVRAFPGGVDCESSPGTDVQGERILVYRKR